MELLLPKNLLLVFAFLASWLSSCYSVDHAFLVVHKTASVSKVKSAERITVSINLYNVGSSTAYDVSLNDDTWPDEKFDVVSGNTSSSWDKLEGGKSLVHNFVLEPKEKGPFHGAPAVVKYRVAAKSQLQEAYSTPLSELDLLSDRPPEEKYAWLKEFAVKYGPIASVISIVGLVAYLLVVPSKPKYSKSKKRR